MKKLGKEETAFRAVPPKVSPAKGWKAIERAISRIDAKARIDFCREVRGE